MDYSQSMFLPSTQSFPSQGGWRDACANFDSLDKRTDLFCESEIRIKHTVNKIISDTFDLLNKVNLKTIHPPFLQNTLQLYRSTSFEKINILLRFSSFKQQQHFRQMFYQKIDQELASGFIEQLQEPYFSHILYENYKVPTQLEPDVLKKTLSLYEEMHELAVAIGQWCIELELSSDIVNRVNLYAFCDTKKTYFLSEKIKREFDIEKIQLNSAGNKTLKDFVFKKGLVLGVRKLSTMFASKGLSWGTVLSVAYSVAIGAANPIVAVFIGGMGNSVVGNALSQISQYLEKDDKRKLIKQLIQELKPITEKLRSQNKACEKCIEECFAAKTENAFELAKLELKYSLENLFQSDFDEYTFMQDGILKEDTVGEWNVIDYADELIEEQQDDYDLIDLPQARKR